MMSTNLRLKGILPYQGPREEMADSCRAGTTCAEEILLIDPNFGPENFRHQAAS